MSFFDVVIIGVIAIPLMEWVSIWKSGSRYRRVKKEMGDDPIARLVLRDVEKFYSHKWYHLLLPLIGALMLISRLLDKGIPR